MDAWAPFRWQLDRLAELGLSEPLVEVRVGEWHISLRRRLRPESADRAGDLWLCELGGEDGDMALACFSGVIVSTGDSPPSHAIVGGSAPEAATRARSRPEDALAQSAVGNGAWLGLVTLPAKAADLAVDFVDAAGAPCGQAVVELEELS